MLFAQSDWLWLLALVPLLSGLYGWHWWWKTKLAASLGNPRLISRRSGRKQVLQFVLVMVALSLMILALARPQWGERARTVEREGIDVVLALDISRSMLAADVNPSRLRAAKDELARVLTQLRGDRVGLVVFTGVSFAQSPLTSDYGAIRFYLRRLDPSDMPVGGTASGRALLDAVELLTGERLKRSSQSRKPGDDKPIKRAKTQVVVLITDGEDHQGDPSEAAEMARERGIKVYTVGFGSEKGEPIPVYDANGQRTEYLRDRQGNTVYTKLNPGPLQDVARITGGEYFHYNGQGSMANAVTTSLNALEKEELASLLRVEGEDRFYVFLLPALLLLLLGSLLGERRGLHWAFWHRQPTRPSNRGDETKVEGLKITRTLLPWLIAPIGLMAMGGQGCDAIHEHLVMTKVRDVERGNALLAEGNAKEALTRYKAAEQQVPGSAALHYDLGIGFMETADLPQAVSMASRALESPDEDLRFKAFFNLGIAYYRQEQWKESLEAFKGALKLRPDDEQAKRAYEVALSKVYPPCSALEDEMEENDSFEAASQMEEPEKKELVLCGGDEDWFSVPIYAGSIIRADASFGRLREKEPGDPPMLPKADSLRLVLFGPDGQTVLGVSDDNPEDFVAKEGEEKAARAIGPMKLSEDMMQVAPGHQDLGQAFLRVVADTGVELSYEMKLRVIPPCFALEDDYEDNDTFDKAAQLKDEPEQALHVCKNDEDWLRLTVKEGEDLFIDVVSGQDAETEAVPPLEVGLFELDGVTSISEVEELQTPQGRLYGVQLRGATETKEVLLRVRGAENNHQGPYRVLTYRFGACDQGGDDRLEENDDKSRATELPRGEGPVRHLRYCPGDPDFFTIKAQKDDQIVLGLKHDDAPEDLDAVGVTPMAFRLWDETGDTLVVESQVVEVAPPAVSPVQMALATEKIEDVEEGQEKGFILEVDAQVQAPRYYHIIPLDGDKSQPPQEQPQEQQDQGDEGDEGDKEEQESEPKPDDKGEEGEDKKEPEPSEEEARRESIEELLENLEESDDNFQLKKALENVPERYIENDW